MAWHGRIGRLQDQINLQDLQVAGRRPDNGLILHRLAAATKNQSSVGHKDGVGRSNVERHLDLHVRNTE